MGLHRRPEIAGFLHKAYKTLQFKANKTAASAPKINGIRVVQAGLMSAQNDFPESFEDSERSLKSRSAAIFPAPATIRLLLADVVLILLHACLGALYLAGVILEIPDILRIDRDWSLGEMLNYAKWVALACLSALLFQRQRHAIFLGTFILSLVALLDDSLQLHERFSPTLVSTILPGVHLPPGTGELVFILLEMTVLAGSLIYGWIKAPTTVRRQVVPLFLLLGTAAFCAAIIDFAHSYAPENSVIGGILGILEDGGEMVFLSLAVCYAAGLAARAKATALA